MAFAGCNVKHLGAPFFLNAVGYFCLSTEKLRWLKFPDLFSNFEGKSYEISKEEFLISSHMNAKY